MDEKLIHPAWQPGMGAWLVIDGKPTRPLTPQEKVNIIEILTASLREDIRGK